ncbi:helix-turn-helix domain-containing protein [Clostridium rectalis]|uniref:helix-turn-helix domain-containing protein n=1 Tax=Clostridium rectalis TaxID=2040295 RepID=UPI000F6359E7|nr:helix-turn-helix domain-containing protein [Clostridium rectalis]
MKNFSEDKVVDAEFFDVDDEIENKDSKTKVIRGEPFFYTTSQVAQKVGLPKSTITYWTRVFKDLLDVENKRYRKIDIEKLKFIKKLTKEDGLTLKQVSDYCSSKGFDINEIEQSVVDSSNPLAIQTIISALSVEIDRKLNCFSNELLSKIDEKQNKGIVIKQEMNDKLNETIALTVDEIISEKLDQSISEFKSYVDDKERQATSRDIEMIDMLKHNLQERKKQQEELEAKKKKSFLGRLFGR